MEYYQSNKHLRRGEFPSEGYRFCVDRIPGAARIGFCWAIPADAKKPNDERNKSGKYIKEK